MVRKPRTGKLLVYHNLSHDTDLPLSIVRGVSSSTSVYVETWSDANASQSNRPAQQLSLINQNQHNLMRAHQDTITALLSIESPFRGGVVSGDRAGVLKVWRIEGPDVA